MVRTVRVGMSVPVFGRLIAMKEKETGRGLDVELTEEEAAELIEEVEAVLEAIRNGEIDGEYFEF